ncbi:MAG: DUF3667 domain-containing protein [Hyphomonadaceae bacterium]|nr:DUF3667 domain-containing protein [Hyphomonadaceae bacterium]
MSEIGAAGAAATAGLVASAIEGKAGGRGRGHGAGGGACLNCGADLAGPYCHACGQPAHISRTLGDVIHDFLHAFLHLDTKAWRTFPQLVVRPGTMTHAYIHGQRARYVSPLALFLFTIFLMFFVVSLVGGPMLEPAPQGPLAERVLNVQEAQAAVDVAQKRRDEAVAALAEAETEAAKMRKEDFPGAGGAATGILAGARGSLTSAEERLERAKSRLALAQANEARLAQQEEAPPAPAAPAAAAASPPAAASGARDAVNVQIERDDGTVIDTDDRDDDRPWQEQLREAVLNGEVTINSGSALADARIKAQLLNPDLALYKLQETASKFSFLLVPISLPFIAFLFMFKRGVTLFDHVVFSLYSLSFMSLFFVSLVVIGGAGEWAEAVALTAAFLVPPVHMFYHLQGAYRLKWWSAFWRTALLLFFILFTIIIFALAILALGLLA